MDRRARRSWKPEILGLEVRDVPTVVSPLAFGGAGLRAKQADMSATAAASALGNTEVDPSFPLPGQSPTPLDPATLTPQGRARARFRAVANGPYAVSAPTFVGKGVDVTYVGSLTSNQFLHGTFVIKIETPSTPGDPVIGYAALRNRNVAATGTILGLDLVSTATDAAGRPTQFSWAVDTNASGGSYAGSSGSGTLTIGYTRSGHAKLAAGSATLKFDGFVLSSGVTNITDFTLGKFG